MTREQLQATRAERWRQNGEALLTLEAAQEWLQETGICLFLPRKMQLPAPAPSFVEACLGETNATPPRSAIEAATAMLVRLIDAGDVIALNLLGMAGEQPDFLVTPEFLPYIYSLRGDRDWKHEPPATGAGRVSPLVLEVWKTIERTGVQTAIEIRETLGKELTEAAVLRALNALWTGMRVTLLPGENGEPATWEALKTRYEKALAAGTATSHVTALSVLLARYLQSAVAATSEEAEIFLSPLASRSKVREVIRGLSATRQLETYSLDTQPLLFVEGTLPEFGEPVAPSDIEALPAREGTASFAGTSLATGSVPGPVSGSIPGSRIRKYTRRPVTGPDPLRWKRDSSVPPPPGERRSERGSERQSSTGDAARDKGRRPARPEGEKFAARRAASEGGEKKRWTPREGSERPRREAGFSKPSARPAGRFAPRREGGVEGRDRQGDRPSRPYTPRPAGSRPSGFSPRGSRPAAGGRPGYPKAAGGKFGPRREAGAVPGEGAGSAKKGRWVPRTGAGDGRAERPRREGGFAGPSGRISPRTGGPAKSGWTERAGKTAKAASSGTSSRPAFGSRPTGSRSFGARSAGARPGGDRQARPYSKPGGGKFSPRREGSGGPRREGAGGERPSRPYTRPRPEGSRPPRPEGSPARPGGGFERKRSEGGASGERRPRTFAARPSSGRAGFKPRPGGKPARTGKPGGFGKKRGPGDYPPRKKRPE